MRWQRSNNMTLDEQINDARLTEAAERIRCTAGLAALIESWRNAAQALAQTYRNTRHLHKDSAERCRVRSETYSECAARLESQIAANAGTQRQPPGKADAATETPE